MEIMTFFLTKKIIGFFKTATPKNFWIDKICILKSEAYSLVCSNSKVNKSSLAEIAKITTDEVRYEDYQISLYERNGIKKVRTKLSCFQ